MNDAAEALSGIRDFFDKLSPPDEIVIRGAFGGEYKVSSRINGRAEIAIMRALKALSDKGITIEAKGEGIAGWASAVMELAVLDEFVEAVETCFKSAYPHLIESEKALAKENGHKGKTDVLDLFALTEASKVFFPFSASLLMVIGDMVSMIES